MKAERLIPLVLVVATLAVFAPVRHFDFVNYDDPINVTENPRVQHGLTAASIHWAFANGEVGMWIPLTWLSLLVDSQLYGLSAGGYHVTNLLLHLVNTLLLYGLLRRLTGTQWQSGLVAALFALHPLHVESVAWVTERRDVLSACFWLLTMWAYVAFVRRQSAFRYLLVLFLYGMGLMAKPMLVTLPFVLLLLDIWPLGRWLEGGRWRLVVEKIPLLLLAVIAGVLAVVAQRQIGALVTVESLPLTTRVSHAAVAYLQYIGKMIWPAGLAVFYPYPQTVPLWQITGAGVILVCTSVLTLRRRDYLMTGWFWFFVTLLPVSGVIQVGSFAMADRFTYVPLIGLFIMVAWGTAEWVGASDWRRRAVAVTVGVTLLALAVTARCQLRYWRDSSTLFEHALAVTQDNWMAHNGLGIALSQQGQLEEARRHFLEAIRLNPGQAALHKNLGNVLAEQSKLPEAIDEYHIALQLKPEDTDVRHALATAHYNRAVQLAGQGQTASAIRHLQEALRLQPDDPQAHYNLANLLVATGHAAEAIPHYEAALRVRPNHAETHTNLGNALLAVGRTPAAVAQYRQALQLDPQQVAARHNLAVALGDQR